MSRKKIKFESNDEGEPEKISKPKRTQREIAVQRAEHFALAENITSSNSQANPRSSGASRVANISTPSGVVNRVSNELKDDGIRGSFSIATQILANAEETRKVRERVFQESLLSSRSDVTDAELSTLDKFDQLLVKLTRKQATATAKQPANQRKLTGPIDSLLILSVRTLVSVFDRVPDLFGVNFEARALIAEELGKARRLDSRAAMLLAGPGVDSLCLPECSLIDEAVLINAIETVSGASQIDGVEPVDQSSMSALRQLHLRNCGHSFTDKAISTLSKTTLLHSLESLQITGCYKLNDEALEALLWPASGPQGGLKLTSLDLSASSRLTVRGITSISRLQHLQSLTLDNAIHLTDEALLPLVGTPLQPAPPLAHLSLAGLASITDASMVPLITHFGPQLQSLNISGCASVTDDTLMQIRAACAALEKLNISHLTDVSTTALLALFFSAEILRDMQIVSQLALSDTPAMEQAHDQDRESAGVGSKVAPLTLDKGIRTLQEVRLAGLPALTDEVLHHLAGSAGAKLRVLDVGGCSKLTSRFAVMLSVLCPSLEKIDLSFVRLVSSEALAHMVNSCPRLTHMHVWGCTQLTEAAFYAGHANMSLLIVGQNRDV